MKGIIYMLIILSINSCKAQKNEIMEQEIMIPKITKEFEVFDIERYNNIKSNGKTEQRKGSFFEIFIDYSNGYSKVSYNDNSLFYTVKNFYPNGNIEIKGVRFNKGSEYGIWYEYDEQGNLVKEINTDAGYDFGWLEVIRYCEKHKIPLTKGYKERGGFHTLIFKKEIETKKVWEITYQVSGDELEKITLDGKTGEEIKREKIEFINH